MEKLILEITKGVQERLKAGVAWGTAIEWAMLETLSAVPDGLELPGEVGRTPYRARVIWDEWLIKVLGDGATQFIALTWTGKEDEKDGK